MPQLRGLLRRYSHRPHIGHTHGQAPASTAAGSASATNATSTARLFRTMISSFESYFKAGRRSACHDPLPPVSESCNFFVMNL